MVKREMTLFSEPGRQNTEATLQAARERALELHLKKMVLATSTGETALHAAQVRLRPILMTAAVLVASMLPLSIHLAPGGEAMIPLARALIGGMVVSTFLTLFLVPCVYTLVKRDAVSAAAA